MIRGGFLFGLGLEIRQFSIGPGVEQVAPVR